MYCQDWDSRGPFAGRPPTVAGQYSYSQDWQFTIQPYLMNTQILRCPSLKGPGRSLFTAQVDRTVTCYPRSPQNGAPPGCAGMATR
jgi:hypothetical protein